MIWKWKRDCALELEIVYFKGSYLQQLETPTKQPRLPENCYTLFFKLSPLSGAVSFSWFDLRVSVLLKDFDTQNPGPLSSCHWGHDVLMARCLFSPHGSWNMKICSLSYAPYPPEV